MLLPPELPSMLHLDHYSKSLARIFSFFHFPVDRKGPWNKEDVDTVVPLTFFSLDAVLSFGSVGSLLLIFVITFAGRRPT